jgi:hypothetical protein
MTFYLRNHNQPRRILLVAGDAAEADSLPRTMQARARGTAQVLVVAPALNSRLRHWTSDEDGARAAAEDRLRRCLTRLRAHGVQAEGVVGDADPLQAVADTLPAFPADELVIATGSARGARRLHHSVVERARSRFDLPVLHVVATPDAQGLPRAA